MTFHAPVTLPNVPGAQVVQLLVPYRGLYCPLAQATQGALPLVPFVPGVHHVLRNHATWPEAVQPEATTSISPSLLTAAGEAWSRE